jgi:hypothetical protein
MSLCEPWEGRRREKNKREKIKLEARERERERERERVFIVSLVRRCYRRKKKWEGKRDKKRRKPK